MRSFEACSLLSHRSMETVQLARHGFKILMRFLDSPDRLIVTSEMIAKQWRTAAGKAVGNIYADGAGNEDMHRRMFLGIVNRFTFDQYVRCYRAGRNHYGPAG